MNLLTYITRASLSNVQHIQASRELLFADFSKSYALPAPMHPLTTLNYGAGLDQTLGSMRQLTGARDSGYLKWQIIVIHLVIIIIPLLQSVREAIF